MPVPSSFCPPIVLIYLKLHNSQGASVLSISFDLYDNPTGQNLSLMFFSGEEPKAPERGIKFPKVTQLASDGARTHLQDLSQSAWAPLAFSALLLPQTPLEHLLWELRYSCLRGANAWASTSGQSCFILCHAGHEREDTQEHRRGVKERVLEDVHTGASLLVREGLL